MLGIDLLVTELKQIEDWRKARGQRYKLFNLLAIVILAVIAGADDYVALSAYCKSKKTFLVSQGLLDGKNFPSHDLFRLILQSLNFIPVHIKFVILRGSSLKSRKKFVAPF